MPSIELIYDFVLTHDKISLKALRNRGFADYIDELIAKKIIARESDNTFIFLDVDGLHNYGLTLKKQKDIPKSIRCYVRALHFNPNHYESAMVLFRIKASHGEYLEAIKYLRILMNNPKNTTDVSNFNYYLYLLSLLIELPVDLKKYLEGLNAEDYQVKGSINSPNNSYRLLTFRKQYASALRKLKALDYDFKVKNDVFIIEILTKKVHSKFTPNGVILSNNINKGDYEKALKDIEGFTEGNIYYTYLKKVLEALIKIETTEEIPVVEGVVTSNMFTAIDSNDFDRAILLSEEYINKNGMNKNKNPLYLALFRIKKHIGFINNKKASLGTCSCQVILDNIKKIHRDGLIALNDLNDSLKKEITDYCNSVDFLEVISLSDSSLAIVEVESVNKVFGHLMTKGNMAFYADNYEEAIKYYRKALLIHTDSEYLYAMLGRAYIRLNNIDLAISYLQVATIVSRNNGTGYDYSRMIESLQGKKEPEEDEKVFVEVKEEEFTGNPVDNLRIVIYLMETGMDINSACKHAGLNYNQTLLVYLTFAREYYSIGDSLMGDAYLAVVAKAKDKSSVVKDFLSEIKNNKKLYLNKRVPAEDSMVNGLKRVKPGLDLKPNS